jgi:selenocysteine-specific elongation factor
MVAGVTGADAVLLVVAANEGVKPQTREHLTIARLLGVRKAVIAVTKRDLVAADEAETVGVAAAALARELGLQGTAPVPVSALTGEGLEPVRGAIADLVARQPPHPDDGFAYLPIDRAFLMHGQGLVVTGTLRRGRLTAETPVELHPAGAPVRIRGLQVHGCPVARAEPGQRVAINLKGVEGAAVVRGMALASAGALAPAEWMTVELRAAPDAAPLPTGARLELLIGADQIPARLRLLDRDRLEPGAAAIAQLRCARPLAAPARDGFVLRAPSPALTVAGGRVLDPQTRRLRRREPQRLRRLDELAAAEDAARLKLVLADAGGAGVRLTRLARLAGLSPERAAADAAALGAQRLTGDVLVARAALERAQARVAAALETADAPLPRGRLAERLARLGPEVLDAAVANLVAAGRARVEGGRVGLVRAAQERARTDAEAELARRFGERLRAGGLRPPDLAAEAPGPEARRVLDKLVRQGVAVRAVDRGQKRAVLFHADAVEAARRRLTPLLQPPGLLTGDAGRALGVSRKYAIPLLEHLDAVRFTRRIGDRRVLADHGGS